MTVIGEVSITCLKKKPHAGYLGDQPEWACPPDRERQKHDCFSAKECPPVAQVQPHLVFLCAEFPSLSWLAGSQEAALRGIRRVVAEVREDMESNDEAIPEPLASKRYSGRFLVRVSPDVHRDLALEAAESGISLNRLASAKLSK